MDKKYKILSDNRDILVLLIIPVAILAKCIEHFFLPIKYFYDSLRMLSMVLQDGMMLEWDGSYEVTADFFRRINVFGYTSLLQWSILIGIIFNMLIIFAFSKVKYLDFLQSMFAAMCIALCNIYVFNLGKDIIQFSFFLMCFFIICIDKLPICLKVAGCAYVFYWESTFFRNYYIIMAAFTIGVYLIFYFVRKKRIGLNARKVFAIICVLFFLMYIFLAIASVYMNKDYMEIMNCKKNTTNLGAVTTIDDKIEHNGNIRLYMINYIINAIRMMFPFELLTGGVFYIPFFIFQILLIYYIYKNIKFIHVISNKGVIALSVFVAFFMGSVLFEPDFGSFARHESAAFPMIMLFAFEAQLPQGSNMWKESSEPRVVVYE